MALIKLGGLAQDVRGSLNGTTFSRNRGGAYVRNKVSPVQPPSTWSSLTRQTFSACAQRWAQVLTNGQRAGWASFAAVHPYVNIFGDSILLSGIAMYNAVNQSVRLVGFPFIDDPPSTFVVGDLGTLTIVCTATGGVLTMSITASNPPSGYSGLYLFATPQIIGSAVAQKTDYRMVNLYDRMLYASGGALGPSVQGRFPLITWVTGMKFAIEVAGMNPLTGAIGPGRQVNIVVG